MLIEEFEGFFIQPNQYYNVAIHNKLKCINFFL